MKKTIFGTLILLAIALCTHAQNTNTIKVSGNCGMCKKHIEKAALEAGATTANWDKVSKIITFSFDPAKSSNEKIETSIAAAGYDTEHKQASEAAYKKLDECCQYDRKTKKK